MKTLIEIIASVSRNVGTEVPSVIVGSSDQTAIDYLSYANDAGEELQRRGDWGSLVASATINGDGTDRTYALPANFSRLSQGVTVTFGGNPVRPLTRAEWNSLTPVAGDPRYFLLENDVLQFYPLLSGDAVISYIKSDWTNSGDSFNADSDTALFPDDVMRLGIITYWRRAKGMDYADYEAEYEAALAQAASYDDRQRF